MSLNLVIAVIGFLAVLISAIIDFWISSNHKDDATRKELMAAGALIIFGGVFAFIFPPLGFLLIIVSMIMNFVISTQEKDTNNHNALIAAAIMSLLGLFIMMLSAFYKASQVAQQNPELVSAVIGAEPAAQLAAPMALLRGNAKSRAQLAAE